MCLLNDIKSTKEKFGNNSSTKKCKKSFQGKTNPCEQNVSFFVWKIKETLGVFQLNQNSIPDIIKWFFKGIEFPHFPRKFNCLFEQRKFQWNE